MNENLTSVTASAPGKLMLSGSYAVVHGFPAIVTAVNQRLFVTVKKNGVDTFHLDAPDLGLTAYSKTIKDLANKELPKAVRFIEVLYKKFLEKYPQKEGIVVTTKSDFSANFGFGSSSAVTVAFAKALVTLYHIQLSDKELFDLCYQSVIEVQGVGSGFDLAAALWGETLLYVTPAKVVEKVKVKKLSLVVGYTGVKADTPTLVRMVETKLSENSSHTQKIFNQIGSITESLKIALEEENFSLAGTLLTQHQVQMRELGVSSKELENLIDASVDGGAYGATLSGAGGGDCMIALVDESVRSEVEKRIALAGGEVIPVELQAEGVRLEY